MAEKIMKARERDTLIDLLKARFEKHPSALRPGLHVSQWRSILLCGAWFSRCADGLVRYLMRALQFAVLVLLASCARDDVAPVDSAATDAWIGEWRGPEATLLTIVGGQGAYRLTVRDLDGPRSFDGTAVAGGIAFERDGKTETIRATDGVGTGMKWLAEKRDCLVIRVGEGFCRD
jgi:hypothetical protein